MTDGQYIINWRKHQIDPTNAERQKKYREKKKEENVTVTNSMSPLYNEVTLEESRKERKKEEKEKEKKETKKRKSPEVDLMTWESNRGCILDFDFSSWREEKLLSEPELKILLERFREKCLAKDYRYVHFDRAFKSWPWTADIQKLKQQQGGENELTRVTRDIIERRRAKRSN